MGLRLPKRPKNPLSDARFDIDPGELKERSVRGGAITLIDQGFATLIHMVSVVVLARLLTPEDYGTVMMVTAITGFIELFRELGLSSATVRTRGITHDQVSNLFWINVGLGGAITVIIAASGPILAWFYHKPELTLVAAGISSTSILNSLGTQHGALINRDMRFATMAVIRLSALLAGFLAALAVALSGGTYWALVASAVVTAVWHSAGNWIASGFRPGRYKKGVGLRSLVRFGATVAGSDIVNYIHRNADNVLIGRAWGAGELGLYNKAYSLLMLPVSNLRYPLNRVAFPALSRLQGDPQAFRSYFTKYCALLSFVTMPVVTYLFASSEHIIRLFLGPRWTGASALFSILALVAFIQAPAGLKSIVLISLGRGGRLFRLAFITAVAAVASFFIGLPWGARGVAIGYVISTYLILHPTLVYAFHDTPIRPSDFYRSILKPTVASLSMAAALVFIEGRFTGLSDAALLALMALAGTLIYLGVFALLPKGRQEIAGYLGYVKILWRGALKSFSRIRGRS
jgi:PST family polysaccharide transporter